MYISYVFFKTIKSVTIYPEFSYCNSYTKLDLIQIINSKMKPKNFPDRKIHKPSNYTKSVIDVI